MLRQQITAIVASVFSVSFLLLVATPGPASALLSSTHPTTTGTTRIIRLDSSSQHQHQPLRLYAAASSNDLTPLPKDISPFDKSASKGRDVQGELRKLATLALERALLSNTKKPTPTLLEFEFPPLIGGDQSKSQFDDFDSKLRTRIEQMCLYVLRSASIAKPFDRSNSNYPFSISFSFFPHSH